MRSQEWEGAVCSFAYLAVKLADISEVILSVTIRSSVCRSGGYAMGKMTAAIWKMNALALKVVLVVAFSFLMYYVWACSYSEASSFYVKLYVIQSPQKTKPPRLHFRGKRGSVHGGEGGRWREEATRWRSFHMMWAIQFTDDSCSMQRFVAFIAHF